MNDDPKKNINEWLVGGVMSFRCIKTYIMCKIKFCIFILLSDEMC